MSLIIPKFDDMQWKQILIRCVVVAVIMATVTARLRAQEETTRPVPPQCLLLDSAMAVLKGGDTATAITLLEANVAAYPRTVAASAACLQLGRLYGAMGATDSARGRLIHVLNNVIYEERSCKGDFALLKTDGAVALSHLYDNVGNYEQGLYFLTLADTTFMPDYGENERARVGYRTNLTGAFATHYLKAGDTTAAIARMVQYFARKEGNWQEVTRQLRGLLVRKYGAARLKTDIEKAILGVTEQKVIDEEGKKRLQYTLRLYGQPALMAESTSKAAFQKMLRGHAALKLLGDVGKKVEVK